MPIWIVTFHTWPLQASSLKKHYAQTKVLDFFYLFIASSSKSTRLTPWAESDTNSLNLSRKSLVYLETFGFFLAGSSHFASFSRLDISEGIWYSDMWSLSLKIIVSLAQSSRFFCAQPEHLPRGVRGPRVRRYFRALFARLCANSVLFIFTLSIVGRGDWVPSTNYALRDYLRPSSQGRRRDGNPGKEAGWFKLLKGSWIHVDCGVIFKLFHKSSRHLPLGEQYQNLLS